MTVNSREEAWKAADKFFPTDYEKDEESSKNAGYPIFRSTREGDNSWISDLGCALELNIQNKERTDTLTIDTVKPAEKTFKKSDLLRYLQSQMDDFMKELERYGIDKHTEKKMDDMIACKEMVEALIQEPVNLQKDGKVTVGL